jgi:hypothetical protein
MLTTTAQHSRRLGRGQLRLAALSLLCLGVVSLGACHKAPAAPVSTEALNRSGERIEFPQPQPLNVPGVAAVPAHQVKSLLNVRTKLGYGDFVWDADGIPNGPVWVLVDLGAQTMSVFRAGHEIGTTVLLFGMTGKPTPTGDLKVLHKDKDYWSHTYDAAMPYALRLTDDGVAIHGSDVLPGSATHGCLGVPVDFARRLFSVVNVGDEVMVVRTSRGRTA